MSIFTPMIEITTDRTRLDHFYVHQYLNKTSYWAAGIPLDIFEQSIKNSICFSVFKDQKQIGFARVVTDKATFAYLSDVFIDDHHRGHGYSKELMTFVKSHPDLQTIRRWMLMTRNAHGLYEQFGFTPMKKPEIAMEIRSENPYG